MAKRIEGPYDFSRYGFTKFADGATWELTHGEDFDVTAQTVANNARQWAAAEGLDVDMKIVEGSPGSEAMVALRFRKRQPLRVAQ